MKNIILLVFSTFFLISCVSKDSEKTVTIASKYSLTIPSFLTKVNNLNEEASLEYQHALKEFYVIALDDSKEAYRKTLVNKNLTNRYDNDFSGYVELLMFGMEHSLNIYQKSELKDTLINELPAKTIQISGRMDGIDAYCYLAFINGEKNYYNIMTWTIADKKYKYASKMIKLIHSFKEL
ncbi:MAG: hypothetical protein ACOC2U_04275 [bacterium]